MPYSKHTWSTQEPITKDRMDNIEKGIADVTSIAEANETKIGYTSNEITTGGNIKQRLNNLSNTVTTLNGQVDASFRSDLNAIKTQVNDARGDLTLAQTLQNIRDSIVPVKNNADTAMDAINKAHRNTGDTLKDRFEAIEDVNETQWTAINNLRKDVTDAAQGQDSLDINLTNIKNRITQINTELKAGDDTTSLQVKLKNLSDRIVTEQGRITSTNTEVSNIKTTLGYEVSSNPSQATIKQIIENNASKAQLYSDGVESRAQRYTDTKISENNTTLNTRFNSIEGNISTIATELNMIDGTSIKDTNTRVDTIESTINNSTTGLAAVKTIADAAKTAATTANTNIGTGFSSTNTVRKELDTKAEKTYVNTELGKKADKTEVETKAEKTYVDTELAKKAAASSLTSLSNTVNTLLDKDTIVISKPSSGSNYTNDIPNISTSQIKIGADYLIQADDNKYYYWRYINNKWELISGKNEDTEFSSGMVVSKLPSLSEAKENTDYFVGDPINGYLHYRFITIGNEKQAILIGTNPENVKRYNVIKTEAQDGEETLNYLDFYEFNYGEDSIINSDDLPSVDKRIAHILLPQGGGSGSGATATTRFIRIPPTSITTIQNDEPIYIRFFYSCVDSTGESHSATYTLKDKNGAILINNKEINSGSSTATVEGWPSNKADDTIYGDGYGSIDVSKYCSLGSNKFYLTITTELQESLTRSWTVDVLQLRLESNSSESALIQVGNTINISYTPFGAMSKFLHVKIGNNEPIITQLSDTISGSEQFVTIPAQSEGAHKIELWLSANINGEDESSNSIIRDYIWYQEDSTRTILASPMRNLTAPLQVTQYSEISIPYTVYKPNTNTINVEYYYDYNTSGTNTPFDSVSLININNGILKYNMMEASTLSNKTYIPHNVAIKVDDQIIIVNIIVTPLTIDISHVPGAIIDFDPSILTNNSVNRLPSWTTGNSTYSLSVSNNFNWSSNWEGENQDSGGGYRTDEDGKCFIIKAGTYAEIDYQMFKQHNVNAGNGTTITTSNVFDTGAEMKLIFKVTNVRDASTTWFTNMGNFVDTDDENAKKVGIQLKAHEGWLKTDKASDIADTDVELPEGYVAWSKTSSYAVGDVVVYKAIIYQCIKAIAAPAQGKENSWNKKAWQSLGQLETEISATNSYLYFPYSEDDKIELDININKHGNNQNFIMSYEDGVPSKAYPYDYSTGGDVLYHVLNNESKIHIGSPDCDIHIYRLRIYNKSLTTEEILKNFIADGETIDECVTRYDRNSIYYNPELNNNEGGYVPYKIGAATLDPYRLAERIPDVKVLMLEAPRFTTGKKDFVKGTTLRCIQAAGGKVYPANLEKDNWYFFNGYHAGQGTTSDNYGQSARNVDFLFECDGRHAPTKTSNLSADEWIDYVSELAQGENASVYNQIEKTWKVSPGVTTSKCQDWMGDDCKVSLTHFNMNTKQVTNEATSIPNNYFNLKVNVASSENVNNALFQKRYNDFLPYTSPAKNRDSRIKNDMEFVPAVLFIRENDIDLSTHKEFNDTNWHFYALGNLGDSKKTDYTRAYDPTDMYEFTIEISDNNTANSQFQSGVFLTDPNDTSTATVETQVMADNPNIDQDPMKYIYPITSEQWNAKDGNGQYINYRHKTLSTDPFDGDHSFEFRYACCGAFRDGDIINPYNENDPEYTKIIAQGETNRAVWEAFYEWIITSTEKQFHDEAALWFVPSAVEFFYAFTHYYTMMDNRAKNTFWHFAKTGTRRAIPIGRAVPALFHVYEESDGNGGYQPASGTFSKTKQYYTQYAFDLWVYDTDTACGIDNNGELSFPYGKEDRDYRVADQATSGWAFNGSGSIFWRRLSDPNSEGGFANEISTLMRQENDNCFATAQHLINQFDEFQNCFPEEIWRLDIERKYIRTFTGASIDGSIQDNKQNIRFLRAMMQGRKKYQRRQWVRDQAVYFGSKYGLSNVRTAEHTIEFSIYTPSSDGVTELAVPVDQSQLVIKPYQDMYIDVAVGNSTTNLRTQDFKRAKAGERVVVDCRSGGSAQETRVYIFGGEHIAALENLAPMYTYSGSFGKGKRLKVLDLGSNNPNYNNPRFTKIYINANMPLLERFSVKNCNRLAESIDLHLSNNLREFEADGSLITGVSLPNYSNIEILHLPTTVTSVVLNSARALNDFYIKNKSTGLEDYSNLITLNINDSDYSENIDWIDIASKTLNEKINWLYLQNLVTASIYNISDLDKFKDKKEKLEINYGDDGQLIKHIVLSGLLKVTGDWSTVEKQQYETIWPGLTLDVSSGHKVNKTKVIYKTRGYQSDEGWVPEEIITTKYIEENEMIPDIYYGVEPANLPKRDPTVANIYQFGTINQNKYVIYSGWTLDKDSNNPTPLSNRWTYTNPYRASANVEEIILYTLFNTSAHKYTVNWYLKPGQLVKSESNQDYGKGYNLQAPLVSEIRELYDTVEVTFNSDDTVTYSIFDGWEKLPTNISPSLEEAKNSIYNIYGKWYTNTISIGDANEDGLFSQTATPTLEQLLILSRMNSTSRDNHHINGQAMIKNKKFNYQMGFNGTNNNGTILVNTNEVQNFNEYTQGVYTVFNDIKPFSTNNGFTIAIDYQFNSEQPTATNGTVLVGCYDKVNGNVTGFALYNNTNSNYGAIGPTVGYGNMFSIDNNKRAVGQLGNRTMIVIRHPANTSQLWVYSSRATNSNSLSKTINIPDPIELSTQTLSSNAILCLGHLRSDLSTNSTFINESNNLAGAYGTIYWAKYWDEDLGEGECEQLANWPHENMTAIIAAIDSDMTQIVNNNIRPSLYLIGLNASSHGVISTSRFGVSNEGWDTSLAKQICDKRVFDGLPIRLQSILSNIRIGYKNYTVTTDEFNEYRYSLSDLYTSTGYVYLPSISSLDESKANSYDVESLYERNGKTNGTLISDITPYDWFKDNASIKVYDYYTAGTNWREASINSNYYNLRFINKPINWSVSSPMNIYRINRSSISSGETLRNLIPTLKVGDIVILNNEAAYMYISIDDLNNGLQIEPQTGIFNTTIGSNTEGGWIRSQSYTTRSVSASSGQYNNFIFINALGSTIIPDNSSSQPGLINLNYAFTI